MANTYIKIGSSVTVPSPSAASIDFTNIPASYTDLKIVASCRCTGSGDYNLYIKLNTSNANGRWGQNISNGTSVAGGSDASGPMYIGATDRTTGNAANIFSSHIIYIPNYTLSQYKTFRADAYQEDNSITAITWMGGLKWSQNAAINAISLYLESGNPLLQYSTATLYGIKNS